jgi:anti-sigma factor RsiW
MANLFQFDENKSSQSPLCVACEEMLTDFIDETLSPADQAWFDQHTGTCARCNEMVADAQRGAAWLEMLKSPRPEPSAALMERILAQTSGSEHISPVVIGQPATMPAAVPARSNLLAFVPRLPKFTNWTNARFEPRLAMTAAMAFFSIALTLNLTGVRLDQLHARDLNVKKSYYEASAGAVRFYDNLHVVRVMESRVDNLRDIQPDAAPAAQPESKPAPEQDKPEPKKPGGSSQLVSPMDRPRFVSTTAILKKTQHQEGGLV